MSIELGKWVRISIKKPKQRKDDFEPYCEPFRLLNYDERKSIIRVKIEAVKRGQEEATSVAKFIIKDGLDGVGALVSYQALPGGFTICNILLDNKLYSGCSHCIKSDRWLAIRGKMQAFRRALEQSEGVELPQEKYLDVREYSDD